MTFCVPVETKADFFQPLPITDNYLLRCFLFKHVLHIANCKHVWLSNHLLLFLMFFVFTGGSQKNFKDA